MRATVENVGDTDLGGRPVPLYVVNEDNVLLEATPFASSFKPCPSTPFPKKFGPGDTRRRVPGLPGPGPGRRWSAVSFRPDETFDPITWTGEIDEVRAPKPDEGKKGKNDKDKRLIWAARHAAGQWGHARPAAPR